MSAPITPIPGGGSLPIYTPPIATKWIFTGFIVFAGAVADRWNPEIRRFFIHPIGFFLTALTAIAIYQIGFPPAAFAVLFLLLNVWSTTLPNTEKEGFLNGTNTVDWITNGKRWFVEKVMKERPLAIQDKDVATYPVEGP